MTWKNYPAYHANAYPPVGGYPYQNYGGYNGLQHPAAYQNYPQYYKSGMYGGPAYNGELRDAHYYPPGYRHVSPVHRQRTLETMDPHGKVYLK